MAKGMIVECHIQLVVDYPGAVFEGVRTDKFSVFPDAQEVHALHGTVNAALNRDDPVNGISFFIFLGFQIMICVIFTIEQSVFLLGQLCVFQCFIESIPEFDGTDGIDCFRCSEIPCRFFFFLSLLFQHLTYIYP